MHLAELLARRPVPASAVYLALTQRCPLHCAHCSTSSGPKSPQQSAAGLRRFVASFTPSDHPEFLLLTGGGALLRPRLVTELSRTARAAGTRSYVLTGGWFTRGPRIPAAVRTALAAVDHVAFSLDAFHQAEVPLAGVFSCLHALLDAGQDVSVQLCDGEDGGETDPAGLTDRIRAEFGDRVPMLVTTLAPVGRARTLPPRPPSAPPALRDAGGPVDHVPATPCDLAGWPTVGFDGWISACCNPDVLDASAPPEHLRLGHVDDTGWPEVRRRSQTAPVLRTLRTRGPLALAEPTRSSRPAGPADYCGTCRDLPRQPEALERMAAVGRQASTELFEQHVVALRRRGGPVAFAARHGDPARAGLVLLGLPGSRSDPDPEETLPCRV